MTCKTFLHSCVLAVFLLAFSFPSVARENALFSCNADDDCVTIPTFCGFIEAINKNFLQQEQKENSISYVGVTCPIPEIPRNSDEIAVCNNDHQCTTSPVEEKAWFACNTDDDCVTVPAPCGSITAVNKNFLQQLKHTYSGIGYACPAALPRNSNDIATCDHHKCITRAPVQ